MDSSSNRHNKHISVLAQQVIEGLKVKKSEQYIDATIGDAGHAVEIVKKGGYLLGIDQDPEAVNRAKHWLKQACPVPYRKIRDSSGSKIPRKFLQPIVIRGNFADLKEIAKSQGFTSPLGILFDLGISSHQLQSDLKGLSFGRDMPLDMRLNPNLEISAKDIVNNLGKEELYEIFIRNAQEELARPIAQAILSARHIKPINTTDELAQIILEVKKTKKSKIHPATKVFLALRMEVNDEIGALKRGLSQGINILKSKGRLVVISFHETEDRTVKNALKKAYRNRILKLITKKPIAPSTKEKENNPRSRSAKLRIAEKL